MQKEDRIRFLVEQLNLASDAYYGGENEYMSNYEWDRMFDELAFLENETGFVLLDSPTQKISQSRNEKYNKSGSKEKHEFPALSLAKTKDIKKLQNWVSNKEAWISWKLDGLTLVLSYDNGNLTKILTRGDGIEGNNITYMKGAIKGIPVKIGYNKHLVVRGEALILYSDFERMNEYIDDENGKYANPRNLASGTLALDPSNIDLVTKRNLRFYAFSLVYTDDDIISWGERLNFLDKLGFYTVERERCFSENLPDIVLQWTKKVENGQIDMPVDGLVVCYDDTDYAARGNITGHHATRAGLAFKWQDEVAITTLRTIEWSCAASVITPVAIFDPVILEGTSVSRASLCNISEMERLGIGANGNTKIQIIKANKIIPKCVGVLESKGMFTIPKKCPVCQNDTVIYHSSGNDTKTLRCMNLECPAKQIRRFNRFVSRQGMDIEGLSIKTIIAFMNRGFVSSFESIYMLSNYSEQICEIDGFGAVSTKKIMHAIERSKTVNSINFIYSLGIPLIGLDTAKRIVQAVGFKEFERRMEMGEKFSDIIGIGDEKSNAIFRWYENSRNRKSYHMLRNILSIIDAEQTMNTNSGSCQDLIFVITGDVNLFKNRSEFINYVEKQGGKVTTSVSRKTNYLVNNNPLSETSKNNKARELGIPIISEQQFVNIFGM